MIAPSKIRRVKSIALVSEIRHEVQSELVPARVADSRGPDELAVAPDPRRLAGDVVVVDVEEVALAALVDVVQVKLVDVQLDVLLAVHRDQPLTSLVRRVAEA